jgi:hypothetical protein
LELRHQIQYIMYSTNNKVEYINETNDFQTKDQIKLELLRLGDINTSETRLANIEKCFTAFLRSSLNAGHPERTTKMLRYMETVKVNEQLHAELTNKLKIMEQRYSNLTIDVDLLMNDVIMTPPLAPKRFRATSWPNSSTIICTITVEALIVFMVICSMLSAYFIGER